MSSQYKFIKTATIAYNINESVDRWALFLSIQFLKTLTKLVSAFMPSTNTSFTASLEGSLALTSSALDGQNCDFWREYSILILLVVVCFVRWCRLDWFWIWRECLLCASAPTASADLTIEQGFASLVQLAAPSPRELSLDYASTCVHIRFYNKVTKVMTWTNLDSKSG